MLRSRSVAVGTSRGCIDAPMRTSTGAGFAMGLETLPDRSVSACTKRGKLAQAIGAGAMSFDCWLGEVVPELEKIRCEDFEGRPINT
jgi:hypothetical protein